MGGVRDHSFMCDTCRTASFLFTFVTFCNVKSIPSIVCTCSMALDHLTFISFVFLYIIIIIIIILE